MKPSEKILFVLVSCGFVASACYDLAGPERPDGGGADSAVDSGGGGRDAGIVDDAGHSHVDGGPDAGGDDDIGTGDAGPADATPEDAGGDTGDVAPPVLVNDSAVVSVTVPSTAEVDSVQPVSVIMRNTGTSTWTEAADHSAGFRLNAQPGNSVTWVPGAAGGDGQQIYLAGGVPPGAEGEFSFKLRMPSAAGRVQFAARMIEAGAGLFGASVDRSVDVTVPPNPPCTEIPGLDGDALDPATIIWLNADLGPLPKNARLDSVNINSNHRTISWTGVRLAGGEQWYSELDFKPCPDTNPACVDGNMSVIGCVNGRIYSATFEWIHQGVASATCNLEWTAGDPPFIQSKAAPINAWWPQSGDRLFFIQHSIARGGLRPEPRGRSQIFGPVFWP